MRRASSLATFALAALSAAFVRASVRTAPCVVAPLEKASRLFAQNVHLQKAFEFVENHDLATLAPGRYEIDGSNCWANVFDATLKPWTDDNLYEAHHAYIDVHIPVTGPETLGAMTPPQETAAKFDPSRDIVLWRAKGEKHIVEPGSFAAFFPPYGGHAPGLCEGQGATIRKVVLKVLASPASGVKKTLELPPSPGNPRNSEGAFLKLRDGRIIYAYSRYCGDSKSDHAAAEIAARYSSDNGATWTKEDEILVKNEGGMNVMSVSLLRLQNGEIALFYLVKNSLSDCRPVMRRSSDEGKTWSESVSCIPDETGYFVLNNDRVIQLRDGRLLFAVSGHSFVPRRQVRQCRRCDYIFFRRQRRHLAAREKRSRSVWRRRREIRRARAWRRRMFRWQHTSLDSHKRRLPVFQPLVRSRRDVERTRAIPARLPAFAGEHKAPPDRRPARNLERPRHAPGNEDLSFHGA